VGIKYKWFVIYNKNSPTGARTIVKRKMKPKIVAITARRGKSATMGKIGQAKTDTKTANKANPK